MSKRRLGKGIDALLGDSVDDAEVQASITHVDLELIDSDPNQPRKTFSEETLEELAESIRSQGVIQPIILEESDSGRYRIVAGERRFRAARRADLATVPAIVRAFTENEKYEIALIENIQREDLNPIEEARGYRTIMERHGITQDEIAHRLGKKRSTVANSLRLLRLPEEIQLALVESRISAGHARALLSVTDPELQQRLYSYLEDREVSVREAERLAASLNETGEIALGAEESTSSASTKSGSGSSRGGSAESRKTPELQAAEDKLIERLGTRVVIVGSENRGKVEISYFSLEDLNRLLDLFEAD